MKDVLIQYYDTLLVYYPNIFFIGLFVIVGVLVIGIIVLFVITIKHALTIFHYFKSVEIKKKKKIRITKIFPFTVYINLYKRINLLEKKIKRISKAIEKEIFLPE